MFVYLSPNTFSEILYIFIKQHDIVCVSESKLWDFDTVDTDWGLYDIL